MFTSGRSKRSESVVDIETTQPIDQRSNDGRPQLRTTTSPPSPVPSYAMSMSAPPSLTSVGHDSDFDLPQNATMMKLSTDFEISDTTDLTGKQGYLTKQGVCSAESVFRGVLTVLCRK